MEWNEGEESMQKWSVMSQLHGEVRSERTS